MQISFDFPEGLTEIRQAQVSIENLIVYDELPSYKWLAIQVLSRKFIPNSKLLITQIFD